VILEIVMIEVKHF